MEVAFWAALLDIGEIITICFHVCSSCPANSSIKIQLNMEQWGNYITWFDKKYSEKNITQ